MKKEHGRSMFQWLLPFASAIIVILILFLNFSFKIEQEAVDTVEKELEQVAEDYAAELCSDLDSVRIAGETTAQVIKHLKLFDTKMIQQLLTLMVENVQIQEAVYCNEKLTAMDHMGKSVDLAQTDYAGLLEDSTGLKYYFQRDDVIAGESAVLIIIPVDENRGNILLYYSVERFAEIMKLDNEFDESAFFAMITPDGGILQSAGAESNFLQGENIWSNVDEEYDNTSAGVIWKMQNMNNGCVKLEAENEGRTLVYTPVGIDKWALVVGVSQTYVDHNQEYIFSKTIRMLYQLLGVMLLFVAIFAVVNYIGRIKSAEKSKNLQEKADTDLLTGLNNKLATERKIKEYMSQNPDSLGMMFLLDIDNFKKINDTMGHAFGDEVLRSLGKGIGADFRVTDIIGRTGGDEFTIFLKDLQNDENALKEAKKLENFFKHFQVGEYVKYSATASIGAAVFPTDGNDFETLYKSADQALYKAKRRGKNQLAFYDDRDRK